VWLPAASYPEEVVMVWPVLPGWVWLVTWFRASKLVVVTLPSASVAEMTLPAGSYP
jgi:hypothetical protein